MKAKKSYGQHFLKYPEIAERIADLISDVHQDKTIMEVGPGKGMLTQFLTGKGKRLVLVEADRDMVAYLREDEAFANADFDIIQSDILELDLNEVVEGELVLIGNYPYNISSQIVFKVLENRSLIPEMIGMFQKEVANRILADPGSKTYGILSVLTQAYYEGSKEIKLTPGHFDPPPRVDSTVIKIKRLDSPRIEASWKDFKNIVKTAFNKRRKMLRNSLKSYIKTDEQKNLPIMRRRPEKLSVEEFDELCSIFL